MFLFKLCLLFLVEIGEKKVVFLVILSLFCFVVQRGEKVLSIVHSPASSKLKENMFQLFIEKINGTKKGSRLTTAGVSMCQPLWILYDFMIF